MRAYAPLRLETTLKSKPMKRLHTNPSGFPLTLLLLLFNIFAISRAHAQASGVKWTFAAGDSTLPIYGLYGAPEVESDRTQPGGLSFQSTWELGGMFYMFGGNGYTETNGTGILNTLMRYNPTTRKWTWLKGDSTLNKPGVYGTKGVADPANKPGGRQAATEWVYNGKIYLFGGNGIGASGSQGVLNDLWEYDPLTNNWTWINGDNTTGQASVYGTQGVATASNKPGGRMHGLGWTYNNKMYLFGGSSATGALNDVWEYDPATGMWTWIKGDNTTNQLGIYGTAGTAAATNKPGGRYFSTGSAVGSKFYLYGGFGYGSSGSLSGLGDLWEFDLTTNNWTFLKGPTTSNVAGVFGTQGVTDPANKPGTMTGCISWTYNNKFYVFSGNGFASVTFGMLNAVWEYDPATGNWTWLKGSNVHNPYGVYGVKGLEAPTITPGGRNNGAAWFYNGALYTYGGSGNNAVSNNVTLDDLWSYNMSSNNWTWLRGNRYKINSGIYGTQGVADAESKPGGRHFAATCTGNGKSYVFGGFGPDATQFGGYLNDLWEYDHSTGKWIWLKGSNLVDQSPSYGTLGVPAATNTPAGRYAAGIWYLNNKIYMFGGYGMALSGSSKTYYNDLWEFDLSTGNWTWIKGDNNNPTAVWGTQGVAAAGNKPAPRMHPITWVENNKLYMFGEFGYNDIWQFDPATNNWTWLKGDPWNFGSATYGTKGVEAPGNNPSGQARRTAAYGNNKLYLFSENNAGYYNLLWRYDMTTNNWTWLNGTTVKNTPGNYGTKGVAAATNSPGGRYSPASWVFNDKYYVYGGFGYAASGAPGHLSDLWEYDPATNYWTWISGDSSTNKRASAGVTGVPNTNNSPGARVESSGWVYDGKLFLFGGVGFMLNGSPAGPNYENDLMYATIQTCTPVTPSITISASANPACAGTNISFTVSTANEGTGPSYQWQAFDGSTWNDISGEVNATYSSSTLPDAAKIRCILTSNATCATSPNAISNEITMTISAPEVTPGLVTNVSCYNSSNGSASVTVSGGTSPYTYLWNDPAASATQAITGLTAGTYQVNVTDALGCTDNATLTISQPSILSSSALSQTNTSCHGSTDGTAEITVTGGSIPYSYSWSPTGGNSATASGLAAGTYIATTTDANGCQTTTSFTITQPAAIPAPTVTITPTVVCPGYAPIFTATALNAGATPVYKWTDNGAIVGTDSINYTPAALPPGHVIQCEVTSSEMCSPIPAALSNTVTVPLTPAVQSNGFNYLTVTSGLLKFNFKRGSGNAGAIVVVSKDAPLSEDPVCGTSYAVPTSNAPDINDAALPALGNGRIVYRNTTNVAGTSVNLNLWNVTAGRYYINIYEYNNSANGPVYLKPALQSDSLVFLPLPGLNVSNVNVTGIFAERATIEWTNGNGEGRLVVVTTNDADLPNPAVNTFYNANVVYGQGDLLTGQSHAVYSGTNSSMEVTGLTPSTKYTAWVCEYTLDGTYIRYRPMLKKVFRTAPDSYSVTSNGLEISQDFDGLSPIADGELVPGRWQFAESGAGSDYFYQPSSGVVSGPGAYSFGNTSDRAFGTYTTGGTAAQIGIRLVNKTTDTITSLLVSYTGEQWYRSAPGGIADQLRFSYSTTANVLDNGTYIRVPALDFSSPVTTGSGPLDGNLPANRTQISRSVTGLSLLPDDYIWIKFNDVVTAGGNDGLAIDDLTIIPFSTTIVGNGDITEKKLNDLNIVGGTATSQVSCITVSKAFNMEQGGIIDLTNTATGKKTLTINNRIYGDGTISGNEGSMLSIGGTALNQTLYFTPGINKLKSLCIRAGAIVNLGNELRISSAAKGQVTVGGNTAGAVFNTNDFLTLESDSAGTAIIGKVNGSITGNIEVERMLQYRDAVRFVAHPFSTGLTLADIGDDFALSTTPGTENSWWYDDASAAPGSLAGLASASSWTPIGSLGHNWNPYQTIRVAKSAGAALLDMKGPVNQGNVSIPLNWGPDNFLVIGNPYPSSLKPGTALGNAGTAGTINDAAIYTWDPTKATEGAFVTVPNSEFTNCKIPISGAFVVVSSAGNGTLDFTESDKAPSIVTKTYFRDGEEVEEEVIEEPQEIQNPEGLKLTVTQGDHYYDALYLFFIPDAKPQSEKTDAAKLSNPGLNFYSLAEDGKKLAIDSRPFEEGKKVPLGLTGAESAIYTIQTSNWNIPYGSQLYLGDNQTGEETLLDAASRYSFSVDATLGQNDNRFYLRMDRGTAETYAASASFELIPNPAHEEVTIHLRGETDGKTLVRILSVTGQEIRSIEAEPGLSGDLKIKLNDLPVGVYLAEVTLNGKRISKQFLIQ